MSTSLLSLVLGLLGTVPGPQLHMDAGSSRVWVKRTTLASDRILLG